LLAHGHDLEVLRRWTWQQVQLAAECIVQYEIDRLNMIVDPLLAAFGVEYEPGKVTTGRRKGKTKGRTDIDFSNPESVAAAEARDAALLGALARGGHRIHED